jgi:hypothetical protein
MKSDTSRRRAVEEIGLYRFSNIVPQFIPGIRLCEHAVTQ